MAERTSTPLQVRMKNEVLDELKAAADEMGTTQVGLVKLCVVSFLRWVNEKKIRRLPDDWAEIIADMDGRKTRYANKAPLKAAESNAVYVIKRKSKKDGQ